MPLTLTWRLTYEKAHFLYDRIGHPACLCSTQPGSERWHLHRCRGCKFSHGRYEISARAYSKHLSGRREDNKLLPPFTTASFTVFKQLYDHIRVGGRYNYSTTGAKSSYADYSGDIYTEFNAVSHRLGAYLSYLVLGGDRIDLSLNGSLDANYTSMTIQSYYTIFNYSDGLSNNYRSISPSIAVGGELMYKLKKLSLGMEAGYLVDLKGNLKDTSDGDPLLDPKDLDRVLSSDWTGWYLQLKTLIWLDF